MAHRNEAGRRFGAVTGAFLALALVCGQAVAGQHSHADGGDSPLSCAVCASSHHVPVVPAPLAPLAVVRTVEFVAPAVMPRVAPRPVVRPVRRSRAPPAAL